MLDIASLKSTGATTDNLDVADLGACEALERGWAADATDDLGREEGPATREEIDGCLDGAMED